MEQVFDVEQPKDVEQAQRGGTGPKINHTFQQGWDRPKEVEQPQGGGGREKEAGHVATLPRREVVTIRARPGAGSSGGTLPRRSVVHEATTLQRCHVARWSPLPATPRRGVSVSQAMLRKIDSKLNSN